MGMACRCSTAHSADEAHHRPKCTPAHPMPVPREGRACPALPINLDNLLTADRMSTQRSLSQSPRLVPRSEAWKRSASCLQTIVGAAKPVDRSMWAACSNMAGTFAWEVPCPVSRALPHLPPVFKLGREVADNFDSSIPLAQRRDLCGREIKIENVDLEQGGTGSSLAWHQWIRH